MAQKKNRYRVFLKQNLDFLLQSFRKSLFPVKLLVIVSYSDWVIQLSYKFLFKCKISWQSFSSHSKKLQFLGRFKDFKVLNVCLHLSWLKVQVHFHEELIQKRISQKNGSPHWLMSTSGSKDCSGMRTQVAKTQTLRQDYHLPPSPYFQATCIFNLMIFCKKVPVHYWAFKPCFE